MMNYTITFSEEDYSFLTSHLFSNNEVESAAYALCKISITDNEHRLLVREIIPVEQKDVIEATATNIKIESRSFIRAMKKADETKQLFVFIHSHPNDVIHHSKQDDIEEKKLFRTAYNRIDTKGVHASIVFSSPNHPIARVWLEVGEIKPVRLIRSIGKKFNFYTNLEDVKSLPIFFDRQIRAFGPDIQKLLSTLNIGIVGTGGTGSAVAEQLIRLGVGTLTIMDGQKFEKSNINRVYGSKLSDDDTDKVEIIQNLASNIGLNTKIIAHSKPITYEYITEFLKDCDVIFGCTDDQWGRSILNRLAIYYYIPVFDLGVGIDSTNGRINKIQGRVTTLLGGYACLFCRERIDSKVILSESLEALNPDEAKERRKEGYIPELNDPAPSVISFTTNVASLAINELLHRLTGFMGSDRESNEILMLFDELEIRRNSQFSKEDCICGNKNNILRGDVRPLLDITWRN